MGLHLAHPPGGAAREGDHAVAGRDPLAPEGPGDDRAGAGQRERAVHEQARPAAGGAPPQAAREALERPPEPLEALAGHGRDRHDLGAVAYQLAGRGGRRRGGGAVALRDRHHAVPDTEQPQHREVLARLRHDAVVGGDAEQVAVDAAGPRHHVAHEALVAGDVDQAQPAPRGQVEGREAQLDGDAARLLGGQAVGVAAGEGQHQRRLAVVDVAGRAKDERLAHAPRPGDQRRQGGEVVVAEGQHVEQHPPVAQPARHGGVAGAQGRRQHRRVGGGERDGEAGDLGQRQRPPAHAADGRDHLPAHRRGEPLGPAASLVRVAVQRRQGRDPPPGEGGVAVQRQRRLQGGEDELVRAQGPHQRVVPGAADRLGGADQDPRLGPADQLVRAEGHQVAARRDAGRGVGLAGDGRLGAQDAAAEVVDERQAALAREARELPDADLLGEPHDAEVRRVHPQDRPGAGPHGRRVVGEPGAVGRPDLHQPAARGGQHLGHAEAAPDLHQLAARHDDLPAGAERDEGEQHGARVGGRDARRLGAGERAQVAGDVVLARAPLAGGGVPLEGRVAGGGRRGVDGLGRERRAAEVGVQDDAGGVQGPAQRGAQRGGHLVGEPLRPGAPGAAAGERVPDRVDHGRARRPGEQPGHLRAAHDGVDGGQGAPGIVHARPPGAIRPGDGPRSRGAGLPP